MKKSGLDDTGDAVMVTSVLLLSLVLAVSGRLMLDYGEAMGKEDDMAHASDVEGSLLKTRGSMYTLLENEETSTTLINRITLGTFGNPYLGVGRSSGRLEYSSDPDMFHMEILLDDGITERLVDSVSGVLSYESNNFYFHDQTYVFEGGAIVLEEYGMQTMKAPPALEYENIGTGWSLELGMYGMAGGYWVVSGIESVSLSTRLEGYSEQTIEPSSGESIVIRINSPHEKAWESYIRSYFLEKGLTENSDFVITPPSDYSSTAEFLDVELLTIKDLTYYLGDMEVWT